jgi:hypothetical protein
VVLVKELGILRLKFSNHRMKMRISDLDGDPRKVIFRHRWALTHIAMHIETFKDHLSIIALGTISMVNRLVWNTVVTKIFCFVKSNVDLRRFQRAW